jgi:hypothetical protein
VAYCRQVWFALKESNSRKAVAVAERYADGYAGSDLHLARRSLKKQSPLRWLLAPDDWIAATEVPSSVTAQAVNALVYPKQWLSRVLLRRPGPRYSISPVSNYPQAKRDVTDLCRSEAHAPMPSTGPQDVTHDTGNGQQHQATHCKPPTFPCPGLAHALES